MTLAAVIAALAVLLGCAELLKRLGLVRDEAARKLVHVGSALAVAPLPLVISFHEIVALGLLFAAALAVSRRHGIVSAVHDVDRRTIGEILFPLGIGLLALLVPSPLPFVYGVLVLGLADGLAASIGLRYGRTRIPGGKSLCGSVTFFAVALTAGVAVLLAAGAPLTTVVAVAVGAAFVCTLAEAVLSAGFDNLVLPFAAGLLMAVLA